jgi:hypothetical protein
VSNCGAGVSFSWRYFVMGVYKDRKRALVHWYPLPFVRLSFCWEEH